MRILPPLSVIAGVAAALLLAADFSFHGIVIGHVGGWAAGLGIAVFLLLGLPALRSPEMLWVPTVMGVPALHFLWPLLGTSDRLILVDAGDFNQYMGLGSWLMSHPISESAHLGAAFNTLQYNLADHLVNFLRLGGIFLLVLLSSLARQEVVDTYSAFCGFGLSLQALGVYVLLLAAFDRLSSGACAMIAILYAISPAATWPAYASFLPQTVGIAFLLATTGIIIAVVRGFPEGATLTQISLCAALALVIFATWSVYPESMPLGLAVCGLFTLVNIRSMTVERVKQLSFFFGTALAIAILISPDSFVWAIRGIWVQLGTFAHGGQQVTTLFTVAAAVLATIQLPLVDSILNNTPLEFQLLTELMVALGVFGLSRVVFSRSMPIGAAVLGATIALFAAVMIKYSSPKYINYPLWSALFTWNLFKAAQYSAPFVATSALAGLMLFATSLPRKPIRALAVLGIAFLSIGIAAGQDRQVWARTYRTRLAPELVAFLQNLPTDGRLLISAPGLPHPFRYLIYGVLRDRPFLSTEDWQPLAFYKPLPERRDLLSVPISYVLADKEGAIKGLPVLKKFGEFSLLDARRAEFSQAMEGFGRPTMIITNTQSGLRLQPN